MTSRPKVKVQLMLALSVALASCNNEETAKVEPPAAGLNEPLATVTAGSVVSGFKHGRLRKEIDVGSFSISKRPISWAQYRACIDAGVCKSPAIACANLDGADQDVALCVGEENARAYCTWSGGRLPSLSEWMLAARGRSPQRFSWGDGAATCEQHPLARDFSQRIESSRPQTMQATTETDCGELLARRFEVGRHAVGASPHGLEDVLIASGELIGGQPQSHFPACASSSRGCIVYGLIPGAIDAVKPAYEAPSGADGRYESIKDSYAFRCVWSEEGL